jgi:hypothetical protein
MSDPNIEQRRALECLRLASELRQMSAATLDPDWKAYFLRMVAAWTDQAFRNTAGALPVPNDRFH